MSPILKHLLFKHDQAREHIDRVVRADFPIGCSVSWRCKPGAPERVGEVSAYAGGRGPDRKLRVYEPATEEFIEVAITVNLRRISAS
jgi:hypothetical protein